MGEGMMGKEVILETQELTRHFGGLIAVDRLSLEVRAGCFLSIIGPNGAGKTTLFNLLTGLLQPTGGKIWLKGAEVTRMPPHQRSRYGLARSFQITNLFPGLSVRENLRLAAQSRGRHGFNCWTPARSFRAYEERAQEVLEEVNLGGKGGLVAANLSHGDKRKLEIGLALATDPELLLLDEPTAGMSLEEVPGILEVIRRIKAARSCTVVMVEHKMDVVMNLSDSIAVLHQGSLLARGTPEEIAANPFVQSVYLGGD